MNRLNSLVSRKGIFFTACLVLLAVVGCISIPLGDPEKAKVDDKLFGAWITKPGDDGKQTLFTVVGYDSHTSLVTQMGFEKDGDQIKGGGRFDWKMWLVDIKGTTFAALELKNPQLALEKEENRFAIARISRNGDSLTMQLVKDDFVTNAGVSNSQQLEDLIAKNVKNPEMYGEETVMTKVKEEQKEEIGKIFEAFNGNMK
jgi:hypothetical protein